MYDSKGMCRIARTLCLKLGSEYIDGVPRGVIVDLDRSQVREHLNASG